MIYKGQTEIKEAAGIQAGELKVIEMKVNDRDWRDGNKKGRLYVDIVDETVWENLVNRRARPIDAYRKVLMKIAEAGVLPVEVAKKARWSQYAGCSCGCSPGFVVDKWTGQSVFVTVATLDWTPEKAAAEKKAVDAKKEEEALEFAIAGWSK